MTECNEKPYLSETIDYDRDIAPYQFIKIFAGVGSGKNGFIDRLVQGGHFKHADGTSVEKQYVLLVTSRRSKMNEQLNLDNVVYDPAIGAFDEMKMNWLAFEPKYENYFDSPTIYLEDPDGWGEKRIFRRSCVNTNAKIQWNLRLNFKERYVETHPWERFDMIIIDEVHAVLSDASYQSSPFYVRRLIEETLKRSTKCKVIVMTGTPEMLKQYPLFDKAHLLDRMEECINVRPQSIEFITKKEAWEKQNEMLLQGQKFIAFFNHIGDVLELGKKYPESAAVSFSEEKKRKQLKANAEEVYNKMVETEKYIAENKHLPEGLTALLSTSKNKEGINIENEDIPVMFIEAHSRDEVVQMAGRVRVPVGKLYLIFNSPPQPNTGIDMNLYEAAALDGAGRLKQVWYITLPGIMPTVVLVGTLSLGNVLNAGFDQIYNLMNGVTMETLDIIDTLVYRLGFENGGYSISTAAGLFKSVISSTFLVISYKLADKYAGYRIF